MAMPEPQESPENKYLGHRMLFTLENQRSHTRKIKMIWKKNKLWNEKFWCDGSYVGATGFVLCVGRGGSRCIEDHVDRSGNLFVISYIRWFCTVFMSLPHMIRYLEYFITSITGEEEDVTVHFRFFSICLRWNLCMTNCNIQLAQT